MIKYEMELVFRKHPEQFWQNWEPIGQHSDQEQHVTSGTVTLEDEEEVKLLDRVRNQINVPQFQDYPLARCYISPTCRACTELRMSQKKAFALGERLSQSPISLDNLGYIGQHWTNCMMKQVTKSAQITTLVGLYKKKSEGILANIFEGKGLSGIFKGRVQILKVYAKLSRPEDLKTAEIWFSCH